MRYKLFRTIIYVFISMFALTQPVLAGPDLPPPPHAKLGMLSEGMVVNGIPMDIRQFRSELSPERVLNFYRNHWPKGTKKQPGYTETDALQPWQIITRVEDGYLMTVQVATDNNGSSGYLAVSKLPNPKKLPTLGKGFPKMRGSKIVNDITDRDIGKKGRTIQVMNNFSVESNANFYRNHYANRGWTMDMDKEIPSAKSHTLTFRDGNKSINIVINGSIKGGRTFVVAQTTNL